MRVLPIILIIGLMIFFCLPMLGGYVSLPEDLSPGCLGNYLGGVVKYWISLKDAMMQSINPTYDKEAETAQELV